MKINPIVKSHRLDSPAFGNLTKTSSGKSFTDEVEVLRQQRLRGMVFRNHLRRLADRIYDPHAALVKRFSPFFPRFTGHTVAQQSLEYAILLLHSDDRTYGSDDAGEANRILCKILEYQDLRPGSDTYGNFFWMTHWDRVKDRNAVSFLCAGLVYVYLTFLHKLNDQTKSALENSFPKMLKGIRNHKVTWRYTNIFLLNLGGLVGLARVLADPSVHREAMESFDAWVEGTSKDGFHEFNSPTYTPVALSGLEAAWANTRDEEFRMRLQRTMDILTYQLALNLSPNGFLGGAASRAYLRDIIHGKGLSAYYAHLKFGTPCPSLDDDNSLFPVNQTIFCYTPPATVRALALEKADYAEIHDQTVSLGSKRTHVITPEYSLASQCAKQVGGHSPPAYVLIVRNVSSPRPSIPLLPDESFTHQPCATFESRQVGARVVGRLHYSLTEDQREKFIADPTFICEPRMLFGLRTQIREIRVGNVDWGGGAIRLLPGQSVAVSYGNLYVGAVILFLDPSGRSARGSALLAYGEDGELRLKLRLFGGPALCRKDAPLDAIVFIEVKVPGPKDSLFSYAEKLIDWKLSQNSGAKNVSFSAKHADGTEITGPFTKADPDPIGNALHISPGLTLGPGTLIKLINGKGLVTRKQIHKGAYALPVVPLRALLPFVVSWQVSAIQTKVPPLERIACPQPGRKLQLKTQTFVGNFVDMSPVWEGRKGQAYFFTRVEVPESMKLNLRMGYDGPFRIWVDRREVFMDLRGTNPAIPDRVICPVLLRKGTHRVTVAMDLNNGCAYGFFLQFERCDVTQKQIREGTYTAPTVNANPLSPADDHNEPSKLKS